jgi:hypothetical protein
VRHLIDRSQYQNPLIHGDFCLSFQDQETPEPSGANLGLIVSLTAAGIALIEAPSATAGCTERDKAESPPPEPELDSFQTREFEGEDKLSGDYTNRAYAKRASDDLCDQFGDGIDELV